MVVGCLYCCWSRAILAPVLACDVDDFFGFSLAGRVSDRDG